jgi:hypothetical protein
VLNDPLEELADFVPFVRDGQSGFRRACFWTEPEGYALDVQPMQAPDVMITIRQDDLFVPPMAGDEMKSVFRCIVPRRCVYEALAGALSSLLQTSSQPGDELDRLRSKQAQLTRSFPPDDS